MFYNQAVDATERLDSSGNMFISSCTVLCRKNDKTDEEDRNVCRNAVKST